MTTLALSYNGLSADRLLNHQVALNFKLLDKGLTPNKQAIRNKLASIEQRQAKLIDTIEFMNRDLIDNNPDTFSMHPVTENIRDYEKLRKNVIQA